MNEIRFPKRRADNSFVVSAWFSISHPEVIPLVRDYVKAWVRANSTWTRIWRSNKIREERLEFHSEFLSEPRLESGLEASAFSIVFETRPDASRWKDWVIFLVDDIRKVFPESKFDRFES
jgi:hypothetical protein